MINRAVQSMLLKNQAKRAFASAHAVATVDEAKSRKYKTLWDVSEDHMQDQAKKVAEQADYLDRLKV